LPKRKTEKELLQKNGLIFNTKSYLQRLVSTLIFLYALRMRPFVENVQSNNLFFIILIYLNFLLFILGALARAAHHVQLEKIPIGAE
jgi:hypothetical protein